MRRSIPSGLLALVMLLELAGQTHAQVPSCPVLSDALASQAVGAPVEGKAQSDLRPGLVLCDYIDPAGTTHYGVYSESGVFPAGTASGAAALAMMYVPQLPPEARAQIDALGQTGMNIAVPGLQVSSVGGLGDAALFVKNELAPGYVKDTLVIQNGSDVLSFDTVDKPDVLTKLTALAQAALGSP